MMSRRMHTMLFLRRNSARYKERELLKEWLMHAYPNDVLTIVAKGGKHPQYRHADGSWGWMSLEAKDGYDLQNDLGILLKDICVIDVDSTALADDLEERFPVLLEVPCETTRRGRHYYFERSALADSDGYFDGAAQVVSGVDFKTRCLTGTAGVIVVAPSKDKVWVRAPWHTATVTQADGRLMQIPDGLLKAVAVPKRHAVDAILTFHDGQTMALERNMWLSRFEYFKPVFDDDDGARIWLDTSNGICVPASCSKQDFEEMLRVCDGGYPRTISTEDPGRLLRVADMLGGPKEAIRRTSPTSLYSKYARLLDLASVCSDMAQAFLDGQTRSPLLDVDAALSMGLVHTPLARDHRWLLHEYLPRPPIGTCSGRVLHADPVAHAADHLPPCVKQLLLDNACLFLAGGAALGLSSPHVTPGTDYDLFLHGVDEDEANAVLAAVLRLPAVEVAAQTGNAVTMIMADDLQVQIILRLYDTPAHILHSFDLAPSQVGIGMDPSSGGGRRLVMRCTRSWMTAMRRMAFWVDVDSWSVTTASRICKYYVKGFDVVIPGVRRAALRPDKVSWFHTPSPGIINLFRVEKATVQSAVVGRARGRVALSRQQVGENLISHLRRRNYWGSSLFDNGYGERLSIMDHGRAMLYAVRHIVRLGLLWVGFQPEPRRGSTIMAPLHWPKAVDGWRTFNHQDARLASAFVPSSYEAIRQDEMNYTPPV